MSGLPARGARVRQLGLALPPERMPIWRRGRLLKRWRYVAYYGPELMLCVGDARVGPIRQRWWAIAEPDAEIRQGRGGVALDARRARVRDGSVSIDLELDRIEGVEVASPAGGRGEYIWTLKQCGAPVRGRVEGDGRSVEIDGEAFIDESAGYHPRHTVWKWSAGVGLAATGERIGWNLVTGVHDSPRDSERTLWVEGEARELGPVTFADDLSSVGFEDGGALRFSEWSAREERTNLLLFRNAYRQPFGIFEGELPGGLRLEEGYGVMEEHDVHW